MSPAFTTRRRADEFDALVTRPASHRAAGSARHVELLEIVAELRSLPAVAPRPDFSAGLRERLMVEAETALAAVDPAEARLRLPARRPTRDRRVATVIGGAALLGAATSMAVAAQTALPGDSLYPVKRALEDAEAGLASDGTARGQALLDNATGRLAEVNALSLRGTDNGIDAVPATLEEFTEQSLEGSEILLQTYDESADASVIEQLRDFTHDSMETLLALEAHVSDSARDELVVAARTLTEIDDRARALCPSCGGAGITEVPTFLLIASTLPPADVSQVAVPSATRPLRPASSTSTTTDRVDEETTSDGVRLPDVDLEDTQPETGGHQGGSTHDEGTKDSPQDPVRELTSTLTKTETTSTDEPLTGLLDGVDTSVDDSTDPLLD